MNTNRIVHPGFWFGKTERADALKLAASGVGGFCIYGGALEEVKDLTAALRAAAPHQLIISADYEDGLGRWVQGTPLLPSNISIGAGDNADLAYKKGFITACQAKALGVDWVLAPVVDLADTPQNPIVNTRAFGGGAAEVTSMAEHYMRGLQDGGCLNSLKHFPGHGATVIDSHLSLPVIERSFKQMEEAELLPYKKLFVKADSIMVSHLLVRDWDADNPASFSHKIMGDYMRGVLRYKGAVVTDALMMGAMKHLSPVDCFKAGADILLSPGDPWQLMKDLKELIAAQPALAKRAVDALSKHEKMLLKLNALIPRCPKEPFAAETLSQETAQACIAALGNEIFLRKNKIIHYLEPEIYPAQDFKAKEFLAELEESKVKIEPYTEGDRPDILIAAGMQSCGAFRGYVNFNEEQKALLNKAIAASKKSVLIAFGSPFINLGLDKSPDFFLMAGTKTQPFQQTAAQILLGKAKANGKMPV